MVGLGEELDAVDGILVLHCIVVLQELDDHIILLQVIVRSLARHDLCRVDVLLWDHCIVIQRSANVVVEQMANTELRSPKYLCQNAEFLARNQKLIDKLVQVARPDPLQDRLRVL